MGGGESKDAIQAREARQRSEKLEEQMMDMRREDRKERREAEERREALMQTLLQAQQVQNEAAARNAQQHLEALQAQMAQRSTDNDERMYELQRKLADEQAASAGMRADWEKFKAENQKLEEELRNMQKRMKEAEEELKANSDPDKFDQNMNAVRKEFLKKVKTLAPEVKPTEKPSVAVLGLNGVGKSSLLNALAGREVSRVGEVDCTTETAKVYSSDKTEFYDVPGMNDQRLYTNLQTIMKIKKMHLILICYNDRVEHILNLEELVEACNVPYLVVRLKSENLLPDPARTAQAYAVESKKLLAPDTLVYCSAKEMMGIDKLKAAALKQGISL